MPFMSVCRLFCVQSTLLSSDTGDYIYEGGGTGGEKIGRAPSKGLALATLDDYRKRYAQYRTDVGRFL